MKSWCTNIQVSISRPDIHDMTLINYKSQTKVIPFLSLLGPFSNLKLTSDYSPHDYTDHSLV